MTYPVGKTTVNKVCSLIGTVIEDNVETFNGVKLKSYSVPTLLTFNGSHSSAGPRSGNGINDPNVKIYVSPLGGVIINGKSFLFGRNQHINYFCFCLTTNGAGTCLKTGCLVCGLNSYFPFAPCMTESGNNLLFSYDCAARIVSANLAISKTCSFASSSLAGNYDCLCVLASNVALKSANVTVCVMLVIVAVCLNGSYSLLNQCSMANRTF